MALAGELAKYIGNEMIKTGGKELAKAGARSALSSIVPSVATKVGTDLATKAGGSSLRKLLVNQSPSIAKEIPVAVGDAGKISLYRGMHADSPASLQKYIAEMKDPNIVPRTYTGNAFAGDGYHFYDNIEGAREYARDGINLGEPYGAVVKIDVPKNRFIGINSQNGNDTESFIGRALERGAKNAPEVGNKDFRNYIQKNGILGSHNTSPFRDNSQYVVMNNDATAGLEAIENYENGELMKDIVNSGADKYLPVGTKIKFNKDLSIRKTGGNFGHKGVKGMRGGSAPKVQQSIDVHSSLINKAKNYKSLDRFEKMNNPIKGSEIWGEKPTSAFQRDSRAVRINMFPNKAVKGTGITKQYLLNLLKDAYDQGITSIVPSYGSYTKEGASFMDHLAEQGWVKATGKNGWSSYEIAPKIAEWEKTKPLADIYNEAHNIPDVRMSYGYGGGYGSYDENVKRVGSSAVAPVREETLPDGWKELEKYMDTSNDRLSLAIGKPRSKITKQDLINFLEDYGYDTEGTKDDLWKNALMCIDDMAVDDLYNAGGSAGEFLQERLPFRHNDKLTDATNYYIGAKGRTGRLDAEYSDRLGIGRSNTPMSDRLVNPYSGAGGDYSRGAFGTDATWATGESGVSTSAHERMHAWQDINKFDWDEEVGDAIDELRGELKKFYHDEDAIKKYWGNSKTDYYMEDIEQEARMLQSYLDNEGYTNTYRKTSEKGTEWGEEVKPAFDKFFKKLRALSKKGIALPAVAGLVGIGSLAGKKDDKKLDNVE